VIELLLSEMMTMIQVEVEGMSLVMRRLEIGPD
jgi:hypothetical protein